MVKVTLENITKMYGKVIAADRVNLKVNDSELFTLLGPSGCGKTTTLRVIAGFEYPDEGKVIFDNEDVTFKKPYERGTAMVFQNYALWPHMNVFDNVAYGLKVKKLPKHEVKKRVMEVLELVGLKGLENRYPLQLSGGQQQRVALARALVVEPRLLLLDEPLSNLDAKLRLRMREEIKKLQKHLKITTIYVTHDQEEAMSLSDRVAIMNRGRVLQIGTPKEVYLNPKNLFVATFIGRSTALFGNVSDIEGDSVVLNIDDEFKLKGRIAEGQKLEKGTRAIAIMRPEDFALDPPEKSHNELEGVVDLTMFIGSFNQLRIKLGKQSIKVYVDPETEYTIGVRLKVYIPFEDVIVFPIERWEEIEYEIVS
jgi:ABC-type sugar transport system ATPase subunit